ncbi:MAG: hypothetical protein FJ386_10065 [Verrucomicrobia bacterium]|nr:hypothetical protein [Verrucomicrobiota bacterium]
MPTRKDFRVGIAGAGFIVNECHLPAYRHAGWKPVAIVAGPEHLLPAMARHGEGVGARMLNQFGITTSMVEDAIETTERV